ncbi:exo-alpha-sialidase, partial [Streptomyces sp. YC537]|nr:exo-alpha-sialidase [Streptomyces boluensis]
MAGMRTSRLLVLVVALAASAVSGAPAAAVPSHGCDGSVPYRAGTDGYDTFRIPAALRTRAG